VLLGGRPLDVEIGTVGFTGEAHRGGNAADPPTEEEVFQVVVARDGLEGQREGFPDIGLFDRSLAVIWDMLF
jgi:hypothetical protein